MALSWRVILVVCAAGSSACEYPALPRLDDKPPALTFYQRTIEPILLQQCARTTSGCHAANRDDPFQVASGNLDVTSFENLQKRRDLLAPFSAYPIPPLLIKALPAGAVQLSYDGRLLDIVVPHAGGVALDMSSETFITLRSWLERGATEDDVRPETPPRSGGGACSHGIPAGFSRGTFVNATTQASFESFRTSVQPILTRHGCGAATCHGAPQSDFFITCGDGDEELAFNFSQAWSFVDARAEDSQLLRTPLAVAAGGRGHSGGDQLSGTSDADYAARRPRSHSASTSPSSTVRRARRSRRPPPIPAASRCTTSRRRSHPTAHGSCSHRPAASPVSARLDRASGSYRSPIYGASRSTD